MNAEVETKAWNSEVMPSRPDDGKVHYDTDLFEYMSQNGIHGLPELFQSADTIEVSDAAMLQIAFLTCFLENTLHATISGNAEQPRFWISGSTQGSHYSCNIKVTADTRTNSGALYGEAIVVCGEGRRQEYKGFIEKYGNYYAFVSAHECVAIWPNTRRKDK